MIRNRFMQVLLVFSLWISSCSVEIAQNSVPTPSAQATPESSPAVPENPTLQNTTGNPALPAFQIPVTWGNLNLTGKLIYTASGLDGNSPFMRIQALDLATGNGTTIYQAPVNGTIYFASISPD